MKARGGGGAIAVAVVAGVLGGCGILQRGELPLGVAVALARDSSGELTILLDTCGDDLEWVSVTRGVDMFEAETVKFIPLERVSGQISIPLIGQPPGYRVLPAGFDEDLAVPIVLRLRSKGVNPQIFDREPAVGSAMYLRRGETIVQERSIEQFWADVAIACTATPGVRATFPDVS